MSKTAIYTNQEMRKGDYLLSTDGNYKAVFQEDGNFVIYSRTPIWSTGTAGKGGFRLLVQEDNNLVMYDCDSKAVWSSNSFSPIYSSDRMRLTMTNDGVLVLDRNGKNIWSTALIWSGIGPAHKPKSKPSKTT